MVERPDSFDLSNHHGTLGAAGDPIERSAHDRLRPTPKIARNALSFTTRCGANMSSVKAFNSLSG